MLLSKTDLHLSNTAEFFRGQDSVQREVIVKTVLYLE